MQLCLDKEASRSSRVTEERRRKKMYYCIYVRDTRHWRGKDRAAEMRLENKNGRETWQAGGYPALRVLERLVGTGYMNDTTYRSPKRE